MAKDVVTTVGTVKGWDAAQKVRTALFCVYRVEASLLQCGSSDTTFTYTVQVRGRVTKEWVAKYNAFVLGVVETLRLIS